VTERNSNSISDDITDDCYLILVEWQNCFFLSLQESGTSHLWCQHLFCYCFCLSLQESGTSHMWCHHLCCYCFFLSLQESGTSHLWCQHLYCYCFFLSLYKNQVPVICDVNTYTVTVSFCHSTRIRYQSSVMSSLMLLLFLSVTTRITYQSSVMSSLMLLLFLSVLTLNRCPLGNFE
jgi:hypothetical protein